MTVISEFTELLRAAGEEFECDKVVPHAYHSYYAAHLQQYVDQPFKLLEIGIGGEGREIGGASLKLWEKAFPQATIYGLDIYPKTELDTDRVKTFLCDQGSAEALEAFALEYGPFDVIIDDGSHKRSDQLTSMFSLIGHVVPGGYYILEDYFTAYWPVYDGSTLAKDYLDTPVRWLKQSIDIINRNNLLSPEIKATVPDWQIDELHVYPGVSFLRRGLTQTRSEIPSDEFLDNQLELDELRYGRFKNMFLATAQNPMCNVTLLEELKDIIDRRIGNLKSNNQHDI